MTDWARLAEPFPADEIKQRPGRGGMSFSYVDARVVAQRLDDVLTPEGWDFTWSLEPGEVVHGRLIIGGNIREDAGYPNSDSDEEPVKSAVSDALKRCAVQFGVGRHLYSDKPARSAPARQEQPAAPRQAPPPRPHRVDTDIDDSEDEANPFDQPTPIRGAGQRDSYITCPEHGTKWNGEPGDLWHKTEDGAYCRHPENVKKARAR